MRKMVVLALLLPAAVAVCRSEPRWCSVVSIGGNALLYPPIAKAARIYGFILERVIYLPDGTVQSFEFVSGPHLLASGLEQQMRGWSLKTDAAGYAVCESLVIADFELDDSSGMSKPYPIDVSVPSIVRLSVTATPVCLCDPGGEVSRRPFYERVGGAVRKAFTRIFGDGG